MGLEEVLVQELRQLGLTEIMAGTRVVTASGSLTDVYRCNLELRTALRVLINIDTFRVDREQELYDRLRATNWRKWMLPEGTLFIDVVDAGQWFRNSHYLAQLAKDAIVDQFRAKYQTRPSVDKRDPDLRVHLQIGREGHVNLSVDSSGQGLHRRGYRRRTGEAPINEVLAAGMLALAGYTGEQVFVDPMCGSGTIVAEAAGIASRRAPGLLGSFGFERWPDFEQGDWSAIRQAALDRITPPPRPILAADQDGVATAITRATLDRAGVLNYVTVETALIQSLTPPPLVDDVEGILVTNPPYELRLQTGDIEQLYSEIGDALKQHYAGYTAWLISANPQAVKRVGLRTSRKIPLMNGPVEARLCKYELYRGSRRE